MFVELHLMIAFKIGNKENVGLHPADARFDLFRQ